MMIALDKTWSTQIYTLMEEAFPYSERRDKEAQYALFAHPCYRVYGIVEAGTLVAFLAAWELPSVRFVEHLASAAKKRGSGIGKTLLQDYIDQGNLPILLEVEHPTCEMAQRRIHFYERLGFHLYPELPYVQPSFHKEEPLPLHLMSYPARYDVDTMRKFHKELYEIVYGEKRLCF